MEIKPFNQGNIDLVAEMAEGVWGKSARFSSRPYLLSISDKILPVFC